MKCPLCGNKKGLIPVMKVAYPEIEYRMIHCPVCGLTFAFPMVEAPKEYYAEKEWYGERWEFTRVWKIIKRGSGNLLEIGCGEGFFLEKGRGKGYTLYGIDINKEAIKKAKKRIPEAHFHSDFHIPLPKKFPERYNVVCAFHVLEHTDDPIKFLKNIKYILIDDGLLFLSVPSPRRAQKFITGREWWDYPPHHLTWWDEKSIKNILTKSGFEILSIEFEPLRHKYVNAFVQKYQRDTFIKKVNKNKGIHTNGGKAKPSRIKNMTKALFMPLINMITGLIYLFCVIMGRSGQSMLVIAKVKKTIDNSA